MMKHQRGLGLLDVLFAIALLGLVYAGVAKCLINKEKRGSRLP